MSIQQFNLKILAVLIFTTIGINSSIAQKEDQIIAKTMIEKNKSSLGYSEDDINNFIITDSYKDNVSGLRFIYIQQTFYELPLYNQLQVLAFKNDELVSKTGTRIKDLDKLTQGNKGIPAISPETAVIAALEDRKISYKRKPLVISSEKNGHYLVFDNMEISKENITAELMWVPLDNGKKVVLAWQVYIIPVNSSDYWMVRVNAINNTVIGVNNFTVTCNWENPNKKLADVKSNVDTKKKEKNNPFFKFITEEKNSDIPNSPSLINTAIYRVIPYPAESPNHPGGTPALVTNPWSSAPGNATSLKWHNNGNSDFSSTRGNNVWAQEDRNGDNGTGVSANSTTIGDPITFDYTPNFTVAPTQTTPVKNQQFNITNLFYWNNIIHDLSYLYGFDEAAGNFQASNQGRGGIGNDYVYADAQDGFGTNNANFSTPPDGSNGRMQMFLWSGNPQKDGDVDNGVISHEFAHGISNRLTGGPSQAGCLGNEENMGEGWSDYYGLMFTQDWRTANLNTGYNSPRGIGTYVSGQSANGVGIRSKKYCTNFTVNNKVYASSIDAQTHNRGEIWCATLWDMTWNIINQVGYITKNLYNADSTGGNVIALKLVTMGMKLQPCSPGFIDGRDAILQADQILYNGAHICAIKEAFRRRGMGAFASQGSSGSVTDQVADFTTGGATLELTENITEVPEGQNITFNNKISTSTCGDINNFILTDTLPLNVTYVSGGSYNSANRVVSFPVNITSGQTQIYSFTVQVNNGSYFPTVTLFEDNVNGTTVSPNWIETSSLASTHWTVSNARSYSPDKSYFSANLDSINDEKLTLINSISLGSNPPPLTFRHWFNAESTYDGGVLEISTNGGNNWNDMRTNIQLGGYTSLMDTSTLLTGRYAWTGSSNNKFIKTKVNLTPYANQNVKLRFRFVTDLGTNLEGWYVDNIAIKNQAVVEMQSNLLNSSNVSVLTADTIAVILSGCQAVSILNQPTNYNACTNTNALFTVSNAGVNATYQWQVSTNGGASFSDIVGANNDTLLLNNVDASMNNNQYKVIISNTCPSTVTSNVVTLSVNEPAEIITQPVAQETCSDENIIFSVSTSGSGNSYQWQVSSNTGNSFSNISGANNDSLILNNVSAGQNNNQYRVVISSCAAEIVSSNVLLTVNSPASIIIQPVNNNICNGSTASFNVSASGTGITYQWQESTDGGITFNDLINQTDTSLQIQNVSLLMNNYRYRVIVIGTYCPSPDTSDMAILTVNDNASIIAGPLETSVCPGNNGQFSVSASGAGLTYQWQVSTNNGTNFINITDSTRNTLTVNNVTGIMEGNLYRVMISNTCSSDTMISENAALHVYTPAAITSNPLSIRKCIGSDVIFTTTATGENNTYQWQVSTDGGNNFTNISGETNDSLVLSGITAALHNNKYRVIVTGAHCGFVVSSFASIEVSSPANILSQPQNISVCAEKNVTMSLVALGTSLTYLWQVSTDGGTNFNDVSGINNEDSFHLMNVTSAMNGNKYRVILRELTCGELISDTILLTVYPLPSVNVTASPSNIILPGQSITLSANSTGGNTFLWYLNNTQIQSQSGNILTVTSNNSGAYSVTVSDQNGCIAVSNVITVRDSIMNTSFIYPNPNKGTFQINVFGLSSNYDSRTVALYDAKGARVFSKTFENLNALNRIINVNVGNLAKGVYMVILFDKNGYKKDKGKVVIQ